MCQNLQALTHTYWSYSYIISRSKWNQDDFIDLKFIYHLYFYHKYFSLKSTYAKADDFCYLILNFVGKKSSLLCRDLRETIESGPLCITDLFQNKSVVDVLWGQQIKLIQMASNSELRENQWNDRLFFEIVPSHCIGDSEVQT